MAKKNEKQNGTATMAQSDIVAIAAYMAGAAKKRVDMEDIAVKANEIAPGRFTWRKYKEQIDLELIYKHLWDLTKPDHGSYVTGTKNEGWMLTLAGTTFAEKTVETVERMNLGKVRLTKADEQRMKRDRVRMLSEPAYKKVAEGRAVEVTVPEAERFFRLDDYVVGQARERKLAQTENAFHDDPKLSLAVANAAQLVRSKK
ncbi:hypothetical protein [Dongia sp.]|uniref:hypothetical protein n=1 Tax=Dongia sp. TaxID=1977262 RepID=UPI0035B190D6